MIFNKYLVGISIILLLSSSGLGYLLKKSYENNGTLKSANAQLIQSYQELAVVTADLNEKYNNTLRGIAERDAVLAQKRRESEEWKNLYEVLKESDEKSKEWSIEPIPAPVNNWLRDRTGSNKDTNGSPDTP